MHLWAKDHRSILAVMAAKMTEVTGKVPKVCLSSTPEPSPTPRNGSKLCCHLQNSLKMLCLDLNVTMTHEDVSTVFLGLTFVENPLGVEVTECHGTPDVFRRKCLWLIQAVTTPASDVSCQSINASQLGCRLLVTWLQKCLLPSGRGVLNQWVFFKGH